MMSTYEEIGNQVQKVRGYPLSFLRASALEVLGNNPLFDLEASSSCNIACSFCPRAKLHRRAKIMTLDIFNLVLKMLPNRATVMFAGMGEPLLNPYLTDYIFQLKDRCISSCVITNGILLTPEYQQRLIMAGINQLQISYSNTHKNNINFNFIKEHQSIIEKNLQHLANNRPGHLRVQLNILLFNEDEEELQLIKKLAKSWRFDVYIRRVHNRGGYYPVRDFAKDIQSSCGIYSAVTPITADGNIIACSNDVEETSYFKFIGDVGWDDIIAWKRQNLLNGLQFKPCTKCNDDYRWLILDYLSVDKNGK